MSDWTWEYVPDAANVVSGLTQAQIDQVEALAARIVVLLMLFAAGMAAIVILAVLALRAAITRGRTAPVSAAQFHALAAEHRRMTDMAVTGCGLSPR